MKAGVGFLPSNALTFPPCTFSFLDEGFDLQNQSCFTFVSGKELSIGKSPTLANRYFVTPLSDSQAALLNFHTFYNHTLLTERISICRTFHKQVC